MSMTVIQTPSMLTTQYICDDLQVCRATIERWEEEGFMPKRVRIGKRRLGMPRDVYFAWLEERKQAANTSIVSQ